VDQVTGPRWAFARTLLAVGGLSFCGASLGLACLDYAGEPDPSDCNAAATSGGSGSGVGNAADAGAPECGAPVLGSGSGS
jgi:hypothetical protein